MGQFSKAVRLVRRARLGRNLIILSSVAVAVIIPILASAEPANGSDDYIFMQSPQRAIILSGDSAHVRREVMTVMYDTQELHFQDPGIPRFLLIDREGTAALGIGGAVEGVFSYDFRGSVPDAGFTTFDIPVPADKAERERMQGSANHSALFIKFVKSTRLGPLVAYAEANFTGTNNGYGFKVQQAYVSLGNVTAGKMRSTFVDATACMPTIDYQGPSGATGGKPMLLRYRLLRPNGLSWAVSAEMPDVSGQYDDVYGMGVPVTAAVGARLPDIPAYVQYGWGDGKSHVRFSAVFRDIAYRDLLSGKNRFAPGWGVQLSGVAEATDLLTFYYQGLYGKGVGTWLNDLSGFGYDLVPSTDDAGKMRTPRSLGVVAGAQVNITKNFFISGGYSFCRLYDQGRLPDTTYKRGNYAVVNAFYTPIPDLMVGVEYIHGSRKNVNNEHDQANRLNAMLKYSF
ncbi:MAG: porin [Muribaculaceae bacterium]|nr:porin [Muribaculaceae bacterium]MDE7141815.1 porin [Muribaculaceae bacterium]